MRIFKICYTTAMGKVHRIKKDFQRLISQPLNVGYYRLGGGVTAVRVGRVLMTGDFFLMHSSWGNAYKPLVERLIREYEAGVAHSDKTPVTE